MDPDFVGRIVSTENSPVVVLANGPFPTHPIPLKILKSANALICCDGAADKALKNGLKPKVVIGDLDSVKSDLSALEVEVVHLKSQDNTDLEKTLEWCVDNNIHHVVIVGAMGARDDHTLINLMLLRYFNSQLKIRIVTDFGTIYCVDDKKQFNTLPGQRVSLIPLDKDVRIMTTGMKYQLKNETVKSITQGISNIAVNNTISVTVRNGSALVFIAHC